MIRYLHVFKTDTIAVYNRNRRSTAFLAFKHTPQPHVLNNLELDYDPLGIIAKKILDSNSSGCLQHTNTFHAQSLFLWILHPTHRSRPKNWGDATGLFRNVTPMLHVAI